MAPAGQFRSASGRQALLGAVRSRQASTARPVLPHLDPNLNPVAGLAGGSADAPVRIGKDGTIEVTVTGSGAVAAARAVGGRVVASHAGATVIAVRPSRLAELAGQPAIGEVTKTVQAVPQVASEGVHSSAADVWQSADLGNGGAGVNVGIVDGGFANLAGEITAGNLGPTDGSLVHYVSGSASDKCSNDTLTDHGTAVAEIVHQMAPSANLYLYCVDNNIGFSQVASEIVAAGNIKVVNSSLSFTGETRGDGNGGANTTELAVKTARQAGVLWVQSAGNSAQDHWSGTLLDANSDGYLDMPDPNLDPAYRTSNEVDATALDPGASGDVVLTWDEWPSSSLPLTLMVQEYAPDPTPTDPNHQSAVGSPLQISQAPGQPMLDIPISNSDSDVRFYDVSVVMGGSMPRLRYDLYYVGDTYPSYLANADPAKAAAGSTAEPASSPYALAVGAADWRNTGVLESFSAQGPTIDGRVKPDLVGYDGVSSNITDVEATRYDNNGQPVAGSLGFYGTSSSAPHVAGAAALVAAANPAMDAGQIEAFLEAPGDGSEARNPAVNGWGHGLLNLGAADVSDVQPVAGSAYFPLSNPVKILDTRIGLDVRKGPMLAGTELSVPVDPSVVPADATSVVVEVSGTAAKGGTYLSVYSTTFGGNATVPLSSQEPNATVTSIVTLNPARSGDTSKYAFKLRNQAAQTDALVTVIGYFGPAGGSGGLGYVPLSSYRLLDTRVPIGGPKGPLRPGQAVTVDTAPGSVPATAGVAVVNITALDHRTGGYLTAYPAANPAVASVNYGVLSRPNLTLVPLVDGKFTLQNRFGSTDAMVDIVGYFDSTASARYVGLPAPVRIADSRTGNGGRYGLLTNGGRFGLDAGGLSTIPYSASGLWIGMTAIGVVPNSLAGAGYLTIYPSGTAQPHASNLDFTGSRSILNDGIATLSNRTASLPPGFLTADTGVGAYVIQDAYGYFVP
ncbi:MAG TPA: S8 family serine peptidase [Jatrophihabitans sp.]|nr:S8 family serine peptidase [Jatrophihabitans sp.]